MCAEQCGVGPPAAHDACRAAALLHILVCAARIWYATPGASVRRSPDAAPPFPSGVFVTVVNKLYKGNDRQRHAMLVPVTQVATRIVMWCCGYTARRLSICFSLQLRLTPRLRCSSPSPALPTWLLRSVRPLLPTPRMKSCVWPRCSAHLCCSCTALFGAGGEPLIVHGHHGLRRRLRALLRRRTPRPAGLAYCRPSGTRLGCGGRRAERDSRERALILQVGCGWHAQRRSGEAQRPRSCAGCARRAAWLRLGAAAGAGFPGGHHRRRRLPGHLPQRRLCRGASLPCAVRALAF